jgi:hypothetical protein
MRITLANPWFDLDEIDYENQHTERFREAINVKHERRTKVMMLELFLKQALKYADNNNMVSLSQELKNYTKDVWIERPPKVINEIPNYISHWGNDKEKKWMNKENPDFLFIKNIN